MELYAYDMISPIGDEGEYLRTAQIVGALAADGKNQQKLSDFDLRTQLKPKREQEQTSNQMYDMVKAMTGMANGNDGS